MIQVGSSLVDIEVVSESDVTEDTLEVVHESPHSIQGGLAENPPSFSREARLPLSYDRGSV